METRLDEGDGQAKLWNGAGGRTWVEAEALIDQLLRPIEQALVAAAAARRPRRLLDVGCGTGGTTIAAAQALGADSECVGIDVSAPMIEAARDRTRRDGVAADFIQADAETFAFAPEDFEMIVSRFGIMFFADPVRAFANLAHASAPGAALHLIAWRSPQENPFMTLAERTAADLLPDLERRPPTGPGQFAFADDVEVRRILEQAGWTAIDIVPADFACAVPDAEFDFYITRLGPVGRALETADEPVRRQVARAVRPAFAPYLDGDAMRFTAACWTITARR